MAKCYNQVEDIPNPDFDHVVDVFKQEYGGKIFLKKKLKQFYF